MVFDIIPSKYLCILKLFRINTKKPKEVIREDFLKCYKETHDFQQAVIKLHKKYVMEAKEDEMFDI